MTSFSECVLSSIQQASLWKDDLKILAFLTFFAVGPSPSQSTMTFTIYVVTDGIILARTLKLTILSKETTAAHCKKKHIPDKSELFNRMS